MGRLSGALSDQCHQLGRVIASRSPVVDSTEREVSNSHPQIDISEDYKNIDALLLVDADSQSSQENYSSKNSDESADNTSKSEDGGFSTADTVGKSQSHTQSTRKGKTKKSCEKIKHLNNDTGVIYSEKKTESTEPVLRVANDASSTHKVSSDIEICKPCSIISLSSRSRKKKGRRNQDRSSSAATLDMRSIGNSCDKIVKSSSAENCESPRQVQITNSGSKKSDLQCSEKSKQSQRKSSSRKQTTLSKTLANSEVSIKCSTDIATSDNYGHADCSKTHEFSLSKNSPPTANSSILNSNKIDSLDSFDDFFEPTQCYSTPAADSDDQWTEVNRKFKRIVMTLETFRDVIGQNGNKLREVAHASNAHIETERQIDKAVVLIKGSGDQIQSAYNLITTLANRPAAGRDKKLRGRSAGSRPTAIATHSVRATYDTNQSESGTRSELSPALIAMPSQSNQLHSSSIESAAQSEAHRNNLYEHCPVRQAPVKEYSLFDTVCSQSVGRGLGRMDNPPPVLISQPSLSSLFAYSTIRPPSHVVAADQALLAKAPGYRTSPPAGNAAMMTDIPFQVACGLHWKRRSRKYSDSSSSGRSSEDSGFGSIVNSQGFTLQLNAGVSGIIRSDPLVGGDAQTSRSPLGCHSWPNAPFIGDHLSDFAPKIDDGFLTKSVSSNFPASFCMGQEEHYSFPDRPMTLPRIASDLNPNAPDFVFQPQAVNSSCHAGAQIFASEPMGQSLEHCTPFGKESDWKQFHGSEIKDYFDVEDFPPLGSTEQHHLSFNRTGLLY